MWKANASVYVFIYLMCCIYIVCTLDEVFPSTSSSFSRHTEEEEASITTKSRETSSVTNADSFSNRIKL